MDDKKFEILWNAPVTRIIDGCCHTLYKIVALKSFSTFFSYVNKGDFGGLVSGEENLSQEGNCWLFPSSAVIENARVYNSAVVAGSAIVKGSAKISDSALVSKNAKVSGNAVIAGSSTVSDNAVISDEARVLGASVVCNNAIVKGHSVISGLSVTDTSVIDTNSTIKAEMGLSITISGSSIIKNLGHPINNVFDESLCSFEIRDAFLTTPEDCCIVPLKLNASNDSCVVPLHCNKKEFLVKYNSLNGPMVYNSISKKISTMEEFKEEGLRAFEVFEDESPVTAQIVKPFVEWLKNYDTKDNSVFKALAEKLLEHDKSISTPLKYIVDYLELHLMILPWLLGQNPPVTSRIKIATLISKIIEKGTLDIRSKKFVNFGETIFVNEVLCPFLLLLDTSTIILNL